MTCGAAAIICKEEIIPMKALCFLFGFFVLALSAMFSYELPASNQYANVTLEIQGLPSKDGKQVAEDVTGYKFLTLQVYAKGSPGPTGVTAMRVELTSHDHG